MSLQMLSLNQADPRSEKLVLAYVREARSNGALFMEVPDEIGFLCLTFFATFEAPFEHLLAQRQYQQAIEFAADAPNDALRTRETIRKLQVALFPRDGPVPPLDFQYFKILLQKGSLNQAESVCLCQRILHLAPYEGKAKIDNLLRQQKLTSSEELGDFLTPHDLKLAATVYYRAKCRWGCMTCFIKMGLSGKLIAYALSENFAPNWAQILRHVRRLRRDDVVAFAQQLVDGNYLSALEVVDVLLADGRGRDDVEMATEFLLHYLQHRGDHEEDGELQTKLLAINVRAGYPQVALGILESDEYVLTHYDRDRIFRECCNCNAVELD